MPRLPRTSSSTAYQAQPASAISVRGTDKAVYPAALKPKGTLARLLLRAAGVGNKATKAGSYTSAPSLLTETSLRAAWKDTYSGLGFDSRKAGCLIPLVPSGHRTPVSNPAPQRPNCGAGVRRGSDRSRRKRYGYLRRDLPGCQPAGRGPSPESDEAQMELIQRAAPRPHQHHSLYHVDRAAARPRAGNGHSRCRLCFLKG